MADSSSSDVQTARLPERQLLQYVQHKPDCPRSLPNIALDLGPGWTQSVSYAKPCSCGLDALLASLASQEPR